MPSKLIIQHGHGYQIFKLVIICLNMKPNQRINSLKLRINCIAILISTILTLAASLPSYPKFTLIEDYETYIKKWKQNVPSKYVHDMSHLAKDSQHCYGKVCQYYYFQSINQMYQQNAKTNRTLLLVSGMHGNQYLGPTALLYAYKYLQAGRIIYFPMVNPSGYIKKQRLTYPSNLDPNRDFPIDGNIQCYETVSTLILDQIFRKYQIDITVALHNGGNQIAFNWGTTQNHDNSHTQEYLIYKNIADMLKLYGGSNQQISMPEFKVGTMSQVVYSVPGTFDDWAYAASKYPDTITRCSNNKPEIAYPKEMTNGLVFLLELGQFNAKQHEFGTPQGIIAQNTLNQESNGYISRAIRMLIRLTHVLHPKLHATVDANHLYLKIQGCKAATIDKILVKSRNSSNVVYESTAVITVGGTIESNISAPTKIVLAKVLEIRSELQIKASYTCDKQWLNKGSTVFSNARVFQENLFVRVIEHVNYNINPTLYNTMSNNSTSWSSKIVNQYSNTFDIIAIILVVLLGVFLLKLLYNKIFNKKFKHQSKRLSEKFQEIEYVEETDDLEREQIDYLQAEKIDSFKYQEQELQSRKP